VHLVVIEETASGGTRNGLNLPLEGFARNGFDAGFDGLAHFEISMLRFIDLREFRECEASMTSATALPGFAIALILTVDESQHANFKVGQPVEASIESHSWRILQGANSNHCGFLRWRFLR